MRPFSQIVFLRVFQKKTLASWECARDRAHRRRYEAVLETAPRANQIVSISWCTKISPASPWASWECSLCLALGGLSSASLSLEQRLESSCLFWLLRRLLSSDWSDSMVSIMEVLSRWGQVLLFFSLEIMIRGFGSSIVGMHRNAKPRIDSCRVSCQVSPRGPHMLLFPSGLVPVFPIDSPIPIMVEMIEGAHCLAGTKGSGLASHGCSHLKMMRKSMQPKRMTMKIICGRNQKQKSSFLRKQSEFMALTKIPKVIWTMAMMTEIFIFRLLTQTNQFSAMPHIGSIPKGQTQSYLGQTRPFMTFLGSQHDPKKLQLNPIRSLYTQPQQKAKKPINVTMYRNLENIFPMGCLLSQPSFKMRYRPRTKSTAPWPISPNITPKKKGKVIVVKIEGFISLYLGTPQVSVIYCAMEVQALVENAVGGVPTASCWSVGLGTILFSCSESSLILSLGMQMLPRVNCPLIYSLLRVSQMHFYFQMNRLHFYRLPISQMCLKKALSSAQFMEIQFSISVNSASTLALLLCCILMCSLLSSVTELQNIWITFCIFFSSTAEVEDGQITITTLEAKSLKAGNLNNSRERVQAYPRDTLQIILLNRAYDYLSMTPTMYDMPETLSSPSPMQFWQYSLLYFCRLEPSKKEAMVSSTAIFSSRSFFLSLSFSSRSSTSRYRRYSSPMSLSQQSSSLTSSTPSLAASCSQTLISPSTKPRSASSYCWGVQPASLAAFLIMLVQRVSYQSRLICEWWWRWVGLPWSRKWAECRDRMEEMVEQELGVGMIRLQCSMSRDRKVIAAGSGWWDYIYRLGEYL